MTKKNVTPVISDEEFNSMIGMDYPHTKTGKDTESSMQTDYSEGKMRAEPTVRAREVANAVNAARVANVTTEEPTRYIVPATGRIILPEESVGSGNSEISNGLFAPAMSSESGIPKVPSVPTAPAVSKLPSKITAPTLLELPSTITAPTPPDPLRRPSTKQRKASFDEYREVFLQVPKITDRQPVFLSRTTRDRLDEIVRKLGDRKMSVSGLLENIARQHLQSYAEDIEVWKRL